MTDLQLGQEWRPISTAPKDGLPFLGYVAPYVEMLHWSWRAECFVVTNAGTPVCPTHWQPLPLPPIPSTERR